MTLVYPRIDHDDDLRRKLSCDDIEQVKKERRKGKTLQAIADMFGVTEPCIRYWVNPLYRMRQIHSSSALASNKWKTDEEYKKRRIMSGNNSIKRRKEEPQYVEWYNKYLSEYYNSHGEHVRLINREYYQTHKTEILKKQRECYHEHKTL